MVDASRYWKQLSYYRRDFSDEQILILFFEDFKQSPEDVLRACFEFLEVDTGVHVEQSNRVENASWGKLGESAFSVWARHNPKMRQLGQLFPKFLRQTVRSVGRRKITQRPEWDAATLEWVLYEIAADAAEFLHFAGKPGDYWDLGLHRGNRTNNR